jgi:hypothetical protein
MALFSWQKTTEAAAAAPAALKNNFSQLTMVYSTTFNPSSCICMKQSRPKPIVATSVT